MRQYDTAQIILDDQKYVSMGPNSVDRVKTLLGKLDSVRSSRERGSNVVSLAKKLFHKFMEQVEEIFKNIPKPLEWQSFHNNELNLIVQADQRG